MTQDIEKKLSRREFFSFVAGAGIAVSSLSLTACSFRRKIKLSNRLPTLAPYLDDQLHLLSGIGARIVITWKNPINSERDFGINNDFLAFFPIDDKNTYLCVNHEYPLPLLIHGNNDKSKKTKREIELEQREVGVSILRLRKDKNEWRVIKDDIHNRRIDGQTMIPFAAGVQVAGSAFAKGTFANCAGGKTPWGTYLTCEENFDQYYGDIEFKTRKKTESTELGWENFFSNISPLHYGWVVEISPQTGKSKKLTALGRFAHESATVVMSKDGYPVVYMGDDDNDRSLYKFIAKEKNSLEQGTLYVANIEEGKWISLDWESNPILKENFKDQLEVNIFAREAAEMVGGSKLARPEDIEQNPLDGSLLIALTNNKDKGNYYGQILKLIEANSDSKSLTFVANTFLAGGVETGFACPDNMVFDARGNLWFTSDISGGDVNKKAYVGMGNNALFYVPMEGEFAGEVIRVASAPIDAEFTGPTFSPDGKELFLSVQHPGEKSKSLDKLTSHWPNGGNSMPRSAIIALSGPMLDNLVNCKI